MTGGLAAVSISASSRMNRTEQTRSAMSSRLGPFLEIADGARVCDLGIHLRPDAAAVELRGQFQDPQRLHRAVQAFRLGRESDE